LPPGLPADVAAMMAHLIEAGVLTATLSDDWCRLTAGDQIIWQVSEPARSALMLAVADRRLESVLADQRTDPPESALPAHRYPSAVACCDQWTAAARQARCPGCLRRRSPRLRQALYECPHGNEIRRLEGSLEIACLDCGLRFCLWTGCQDPAVRAGMSGGKPLWCAAHAPLPGLTRELVGWAHRTFPDLAALKEGLDECVHDTASQPASDVNNGGIADQIDYLVAEHGAAGARRLLEDLRPGPRR
jgi:hypothetical protein